MKTTGSCNGEPAVIDYSAMSYLIEQHLALLKAQGKSPATIRDRGRCLRRLHDDMPGGIVYACREQLQAWLDYDHWSVRTRLIYYSHIAAFFRWLYEERIIDEDPAARLAHPKRPRSLPRPASEAQLALALTAPAPLRLAVGRLDSGSARLIRCRPGICRSIPATCSP